MSIYYDFQTDIEGTMMDNKKSKATTIERLTLSELMGQEHSLWLNKSTQFGYDLHIEGYDDDTEISETNVHPCAIDNFADFCRRFLTTYDKINKQ